MVNQDRAHLRLKIWRIRHGISQIELAKELGIANSSLSRIEGDGYPPGADLKQRIKDRTGIEWDEPESESEMVERQAGVAR